jgi:CHAT domain-containing protein
MQNLLNSFSVLSEKEKGYYIGNKISMLDIGNSLLYNNRKTTPALIQSNLQQQLFFKSLTLTETKNILLAARQSGDSSLQHLLSEWQTGKSILAKQYALPAAERRTDLQQVEITTEQKEKELGRKVTGFSNQQTGLRVSVQEVRNNLQEKEVAVEFVRFNLFNKIMQTDSVMYAAYVLTNKDSNPLFIPLCEERQLGKYFSPTGGAAAIKTLYRSDVVDEDEKPSISGDSLYALIWKPLLPHLSGVNRIYYSPAGLLHKVAFHALPAGDSQLLIDKYELSQYTSVRQLALTTEIGQQEKTITAMGDCLFTMDSAAMVKNRMIKGNTAPVFTSTHTETQKVGGWKTLPGTATEIAGIQKQFQENKGRSNVFLQAAATEEQFKSLAGRSPTILHLATHGFFLPDPEKKKREGFAADERNVFTMADDPLLRSGIVLSGANRVWNGGVPIAGIEDGIVTAYEIAQLDLSHTDLVVLSACETALGDIKGNEGVFGLQRAFKLAGVKNMLLSLWKVPDAETAEMMKLFYTHYLQGKSVREAFTLAQQEMRKKYKPYYWAAFVLIE